MSDDLPTIAADLAPTGVLRASINLGNPVLAQGMPEAPRGVSVDLAHALGERLGVPVEPLCFDAARKSFEALTDGRADVAFLAVEPARAEQVAFTAPYVLIEGVYAVPDDSPLRTVADVDADGVRIGVKLGSAYDLFLTRTLEHADLVRGDASTAVFLAEGLEAVADIRQPMTAFVAAHPGLRLIEERFMEIRQAMATTRSRSHETVAFLRAFVEEQKASGFVAAALERAGQGDVTVAPTSRTLYSATVSLDGFIAGPGGDMSWLTEYLGPDPAAETLIDRVGALLVGAHTFGGDDPNAGTDSEGAFGGRWTGPQFVLTHHPPAEAVEDVTFLDDLERAVALAREAAAGGFVNVLGADVARQCLEAGLLDEVLVLVAPVLLGDGVPLFRRADGEPVRLERLSVATAPVATHLWFRVVPD